MPRFSQLFFYDFHRSEVAGAGGQEAGGAVSRRAAEAYLKSGVRLESTCGISDVWYWYVESNRDLFDETTFLPTGTRPLHPHMEPYQVVLVYTPFPWELLHRRPKPRMSVGPPAPPSPDLHPTNGQEHQPEELQEDVTAQEDISEFTDNGGADCRAASSVSSEDWLEDWPETGSFQSELHRTMDRFELPEELELQPDSKPVGLAHILPEGRGTHLEDRTEAGMEGTEEEDRMEGVELSQATQVRAQGDSPSTSGLEGVSGGGEDEEMEDEDDGEDVSEEEDDGMEDEDRGEYRRDGK